MSWIAQQMSDPRHLRPSRRPQVVGGATTLGQRRGRPPSEAPPAMIESSSAGWPMIDGLIDGHHVLLQPPPRAIDQAIVRSGGSSRSSTRADDRGHPDHHDRPQHRADALRARLIEI
jgi:hypothetical protein